ncbi:hypothetical protein KUV50_04595 [Membranicola marinus]|uniref:Uncharacterized protein n=1 Tax=Membranihabitans marinus TaxID=1227546 RepID=A0A953LC54_9BACT|nr:hypothetical protein [Membranihabitans marinus]MBY5957404.1 hypothetical protein [Membranihabitans marinus]
MKSLSPRYKEQIENIKQTIQSSDLLNTYLESEEEADYKALIDYFEPQIQELYDKVVNNNPLQLLSLENEILDDRLEGLFLPRILGYAVLRGAIDEDFKYIRPQTHFQDILLFICDSVYFDYIKTRIGQTVQVGFALNSDIWTTSFINRFQNKRIVSYLRNLHSADLWQVKNREVAYNRYKKQFEGYNFYTIEFPDDAIELKASYRQFLDFLKFRIKHDLDNTSFEEELITFLENTELQEPQEYINILGLSAHFIEFEEDRKKRLAKIYNELRQKEGFHSKHFHFLERLMKSDINVGVDSFVRLFDLLPDQPKDDFYTFYYLQNIIKENGLASEITIEEIRNVHNQHEGLSDFNEALRLVIYKYFKAELQNIDPEDYPAYFELNKLMTIYIKMFDNQHFNQEIKHASIRLIKKFLKVYTYKRGKDYQDIKKYVVSQFQDLGFMTEKEVLEIFKTRKRRRKKATS